jgi:hypothetical protein
VADMGMLRLDATSPCDRRQARPSPTQTDERAEAGEWDVHRAKDGSVIKREECG